MSYETTDALLAIPSPDELARAIRERIQGLYGDPPVHDDWTWTEATSRAANLAREEPARTRLAAAVRRLLADLFDDPGNGGLVEEWPAGLLRLVPQVAWTEEERVKIARYLVGLLHEVHRWPIGKETAPALGSPARELHRSVRRFMAQIPFKEHERALVDSIERLLAYPETEARDGELGALIAIHASYPQATIPALRPLRDLQGKARDRVLYAIDREYFSWNRNVRTIGKALFDQFELPYVKASSPPDLRWAARAALRFGEPTPEFRERLRKVEEPLRADKVKKTPFPGSTFRAA